MIRRTWTPKDADDWTKEDWIAIVLSAVSYTTTLVGLMLACLLIPLGFFLTAVGLGGAALMYWVIDPKLRAVSTEFEKKQKEYLERLKDIEEWKD